MNLNSKYFDGIRIGGSEPERAEPAPEAPCCQWKGCAAKGTHRAPQGRGRDGLYYFFCLEHVRAYNASYNYFSGMSDVEIQSFQKEAQIGHRPTWKVGANAWAHGATSPHGKTRRDEAPGAREAAAAFFAWRQSRVRPEAAAEPARPIRPLERKALQKLDLADHSSKEEIKARFKSLVKQHHPDANGGDRGSEERLREIIQAYNFLKQAGRV
jgi:hypothetical protein